MVTQNTEYRRSGLSVPGGQGLGQVRRAGSMVLDPVCGAGTTAAAALRLGRRFIAIDSSADAIDTTWKRLMTQIRAGDYRPVLKHNGQRVGVHRIRGLAPGEGGPVPEWDSGDSYVVHGDALAVLRTMPDSFVDLVYLDPPFFSQKEYGNKTGKGFSDVWAWDDAAEGRLVELSELAEESCAGGPDQLRDIVVLVKRMDPDLAAYLSWAALLLVECRRVMGSQEWELTDLGPVSIAGLEWPFSAPVTPGKRA